MLINSVSKAVFAGNGIATHFPFAFKVWAESQLFVQVTTPHGETRQVTDFAVSLTEEGGTVTYTLDGAPLAEGYTLVILRQMPFSQEVDLINGTRFDPSVIEDALDKATAERQQLKERVERAITVTPSSDITPDEFVEVLYSSAESTAINAAQAAISAANAAQSETNAAQSAKDAAESALQAGDEAVARVDAAGDAQVDIVENEGTNQLQRLQDEGLVILNTASQLAFGGHLPGMVVAFTGSFGGAGNKHPIPTGSTEPDLTWQLHEPSRGKFILGGTGQNQKSTGGSSTTKEHTLTNVQVGSALTSWAPQFHSISAGPARVQTGIINVLASTNQPHSHGQNLPPYYTLAYIEKLPIAPPVGEAIFVTKEELADAIPTKLPNPHALTINGKKYDGSVPVNVTIESDSGDTPYDDTEVRGLIAANAESIQGKQEAPTVEMVNTSTYTFSAKDNTDYVFTVPVTSIVMTAQVGQGSMYFVTGDTFTLTPPEGVLFDGGEPTFEPYKIYTIVYLNGVVYVSQGA